MSPGAPGAGAGAAKTGLGAGAKALIGGGVALAVIGGGGAVAYVTDPLGFRSGGDDWIRQVPASATVVAGFDLNPDAGQKLEMLRFALKFPSVSENLSLTEGSDLRETLFSAIIEDHPSCSLTYAEDIEPWMGNQVGAFIPAGATNEWVLVLQAGAEAPAVAAVEQLGACGALPGGSVTYTDGYVLAGSRDGAAEAAAAEAMTTSLADDPDYQEDRAKLGASGVAMIWVDSEGLQQINDASTSAMPELPVSARSSAAVMRFSGGNLELVSVGKVVGEFPTRGVTKVGELPADTAAAFGLAGGKEFVPMIQDLLTSQGMDLSTGTGLRMPQDLETILGDDFIFATDRFDPNNLQGPNDLPLGLVIDTDSAALSSLIQQFNMMLGLPITHLDEGTLNYVSLSPSFAQQLQNPSGKLADQDGFKAAVAEPDKAQVVMYVNVATFSDVLINELGSSTTIHAGDIQALQALGMSAWDDGDDYQRAVLRVTAR